MFESVYDIKHNYLLTYNVEANFREKYFIINIINSVIDQFCFK